LLSLLLAFLIDYRQKQYNRFRKQQMRRLPHLLFSESVVLFLSVIDKKSE